MIDLQRIIAAQDAWRDAWLAAEPRRDDADAKPLTSAGWDELTRLREAADEAPGHLSRGSFGED